MEKQQEAWLAARQKIQQDCLEALQKAFQKGVQSGLVVLPPRLGELEIIATFVGWLRKQTVGRILILSHTNAILDRTLSTLHESLGESCSCDHFDAANVATPDIVVGTYHMVGKSIAGKTLSANTFETVVCIDCERAVSDTYKPVVEYFLTRFRFGTTILPSRRDKRDTYELFAVHIYGISFEEAYVLGAIRKLSYKCFTDRWLREGVIQTPRGAVGIKRSNRGAKAEKRDRRIAQLIVERTKHIANCKTLIICQNTSRADLVEELLTEAGVRAVALHSKTKKPADKRRKAHEDGQMMVIVVNSTDEVEGIEFDAIVLWQFTEERRSALRHLAAGLGWKGENVKLLILDFVNSYGALLQLRELQEGLAVTAQTIRERSGGPKAEPEEIEINLTDEMLDFEEIELDIPAPRQSTIDTRDSVVELRYWEGSREDLLQVDFDVPNHQFADVVQRVLSAWSEQATTLILDDSLLVMTREGFVHILMDKISRALRPLGIKVPRSELSDEEALEIKAVLLEEVIESQQAQADEELRLSATAELKKIREHGVAGDRRVSLQTLIARGAVSADVRYWNEQNPLNHGLIRITINGADPKDVDLGTEVFLPLMNMLGEQSLERSVHIEIDMLNLLPSLAQFSRVVQATQEFLFGMGFSVSGGPLTDGKEALKLLNQAFSALTNPSIPKIDFH